MPTAGPFRVTYAFYGLDHCEAIYGWPEGGTLSPTLTQDMFETCNGQLLDSAGSYKASADGDTTKKYLARDSVLVDGAEVTWPHGSGINYLYVDGHVKLKVPRSQAPTLATGSDGRSPRRRLAPLLLTQSSQDAMLCAEVSLV